MASHGIRVRRWGPNLCLFILRSSVGDLAIPGWEHITCGVPVTVTTAFSLQTSSEGHCLLDPAWSVRQEKGSQHRSALQDQAWRKEHP